MTSAIELWKRKTPPTRAWGRRRIAAGKPHYWRRYPTGSLSAKASWPAWAATPDSARPHAAVVIGRLITELLTG
jgi:hypothetical protein